MSRRHRAERREILPDPKFGNLKVSRFMNSVMRQGKKSVAESIVYGALETIEQKIKQNPVAIFEQALDNVMPSVEVRSRRVGGALLRPGPARKTKSRHPPRQRNDAGSRGPRRLLREATRAAVVHL